MGADGAEVWSAPSRAGVLFDPAVELGERKKRGVNLFEVRWTCGRLRRSPSKEPARIGALTKGPWIRGPCAMDARGAIDRRMAAKRTEKSTVSARTSIPLPRIRDRAAARLTGGRSGNSTLLCHHKVLVVFSQGRLWSAVHFTRPAVIART